jgi:hypothetical protein
MMGKIFLILFYSSICFASEGVSTKIDPARLDAVKEWVTNSKYTLDAEIDNIQRSAITDQESLYADVIGRILSQSGNKPNEFLMRNILYRTQIVYEGLRNTPSSPKRNALARRVLRKGMLWAQSMYEPDLNLIQLQREGKLTEALRGAEFAKIGIEWAQYMLSLYYSAPTNAVKLQLMKDMMGLMYNDINNDDAVNRILAPISGAIVNKHSRMSELKTNTSIEKLLAARDLRRFMEQQLGIAQKTLNVYQAERAVEEPVESTPIVENPNSNYAESTKILAACNKYGNDNTYKQYYTDTCLKARPNLARIKMCDTDQINLFADKADCMARKGYWKNFSENSRGDQAIIASCFKYNDDDQYQTPLRTRCMTIKADPARFAFCDGATDTYLIKADCLERKGVWANY